MAEPTIDDVFAKKARFALEMGRIRWAALCALPVAVAAGLFALAFGGEHHPPAVAALAVGVLAAVAGWKSRACWWGTIAGVALGLVPFVALQIFGVLSSTACSCTCGGGGLVAGIVIAVLARRSRFAFDVVLGACAGAVLHATLGCAHVGVLEGLGLVVGVVAGAVPVLALARRAAAP